MRIPRDGSGLSLVLIAALLLLLPLLAALQYRWIGQLSRAEQERMRANLRVMTVRFRQDFDGEFTRLLAALQAGPPAEPGREQHEYAGRFARWSAATPYRSLVRRFYFTKDGESGLQELLVLNHAGDQFDPVEWPVWLEALRARLESRLQEPVRRGSGLRFVVEEDIPVLVMPRFPRLPQWGRRPQERPPQFRPAIPGWLILELDLEFIQKHFLPELVQRYFGRPEGADYVLQIASRADPAKVIYRSDPQLAAAGLTSPDITIGIFEVRPELGPGPGGPRLAAGQAPLPPPAGAPPLPRGEAGRWLLSVKHRSGSLEAAVNRARFRNLSISFAILLLMAATMIMLAVSTRRAQRLARLQMEFVAGVSHELRTPLAVICSAGDNLADGLVGSQPQVQRYGSVIRNEGRRLSQMVEQVLAFAGAQAGRLKFELQPVDVAAVVERALAACEPAVRESGCEIQKQIPPDLPPVMADETALAHCLQNLLANALKYARDGKWVGLSAALKPDGRGPAVEIRVEDKGPGIEAGDLPHIFEPFYRGRQAIAAQSRGAGLGLSLVKRIMAAHSGTVSVASAPGQGSCFTLTLPARSTNGTQNSAG